jgi:hypothetical protein
MKNIKILKWGLLPVLMMFLVISACKKKFLDRQPLGRYTDADIPAGSYENLVFAVYAKLRTNGFNGRDYTSIHSFRSDEAEKGSSETDGANFEVMYDNFDYNKSNSSIQDYWTNHYSLIIDANRIIWDIDSLKLTDPPTLINKAEAEFMRAYAFFDLARTFGRVPKVDFKINDPAQVNIPKVGSVDELFALIDADLQDAATILPESWDAQFPGRLTKGAALALHARTYLWRKNWSAALAAAKSVIALNRYSLVSDYGSQFKQEGENGPESIFEIQAFYSPSQTTLGIEYANQQGVRGAGSWDLGWGWNTPTQQLVDSFNLEPGDPRRIATILYSGKTDPLYGETVPPVPTVPRPYWNKKVYTNPIDRAAKNSRFGQWMNHRIIRYADVLLMAAEAANELGGAQNTTDALAWLEMVRARARGSNAAILPKVTTTDQNELRQAIHFERLLEFAMEEQRYYDLVRWGTDVAVLHKAGKAAYQLKHRLLPIPQGEIDKSGGVLVQNPDYP